MCLDDFKVTNLKYLDFLGDLIDMRGILKDSSNGFPFPRAKRQRFSSSKARSHCRPLSQALRAAEQVTVLGRSCLGVTHPHLDLEVLQNMGEKGWKWMDV